MVITEDCEMRKIEKKKKQKPVAFHLLKKM